MIDRPLRPLFPEGYACETQVIGLLLSADLENDSDTLAIIGASTALVHLRHPVRPAGRRGARRLLGRRSSSSTPPPPTSRRRAS